MTPDAVARLQGKSLDCVTADADLASRERGPAEHGEECAPRNRLQGGQERAGLSLEDKKGGIRLRPIQLRSAKARENCAGSVQNISLPRKRRLTPALERMA